MCWCQVYRFSQWYLFQAVSYDGYAMSQTNIFKK